MAVIDEMVDFGLGVVLQQLGLRRATGRLRHIADRKAVAFHIETGKLALVTSARSSRLPLRLGRALEQQAARRARSLGQILDNSA